MGTSGKALAGGGGGIGRGSGSAGSSTCGRERCVSPCPESLSATSCREMRTPVVAHLTGGALNLYPTTVRLRL